MFNIYQNIFINFNKYQTYQILYMISMLEEKIFKCKECEKITKFLNQAKHMRKHNRDILYYHIHKYALKHHLHKHTEEKPYHCNICPNIISRCCNHFKILRKHTGEILYNYIYQYDCVSSCKVTRSSQRKFKNRMKNSIIYCLWSHAIYLYRVWLKTRLLNITISYRRK